MKHLASALALADGAPLEREIAAIGEEALQRWEAWNGSLDLPNRITHGDLKISNIRYLKLILSSCIWDGKGE